MTAILTTPAMIWLAFAICLVLISIAGPMLSFGAQVIADRGRVSEGWIGLILLSTVTSLPELIIGVSSVTVAQVPEIAVSDVFGSCVFNLVILIVLDFIQRGESVYRRVSQGHILSAGFSILLIGFAGISVLLHGQGAAFHIGGVGGYTPIILALYVLGIRASFLYERNQSAAALTQDRRGRPVATLRKAIAMCILASAIIAVAGVSLPFIAERLAEMMGWKQTFVGSLLVALITSIPEMVVSVAAVRAGAVDMAIGGVLGSNMFNMVVLGIDDLAFRDGPLLEHVSSIHAVSAMSAMIMTGLVIVGLLYRPQQRVFRAVGWISLSLFTVYLLNSYALFLHDR
ncbi:MAG: sodium:calcium antiporter [Acetobacteraceae bacterium]